MITEVETKTQCYHCGEECKESVIAIEDKNFCCNGCKTVYEILSENQLCGYYDLNQNAGVSLKAKNFSGKFDYLSDKKIESQLLDYQSNTQNNIRLHLPSVHCSSCVWLLENFHKIQAGVISSRLDFIRKELSISYNPQKVNLQTIVELLSTLGYEPHISLESVEKPSTEKAYNQSLVWKIAVVGFCMGNIMIFSFPEYFKLDLENQSDKQFREIFLYINLFLSLPVFFYGASDYLKNAWISLKEFSRKSTKILSVDIPIALGISALFFRSIYEVFINQEAGYFDSLAGLVFFLLVGKWVQQKTFNFLSFRHQYQSYFPLAVKVLNEKSFNYLNISELEKGNLIELSNKEIVPTDATLRSKQTKIDYSFVTGESDPVEILKGETIYAGGRVIGEKITAEVTKTVSKSYLTQLWNNHSFQKEKHSESTNLADKFSKYFTTITLIIALFTGIYWYYSDKSLILNTTISVLMVACPCALTLSMPFTMNVVMVLFGKNKFYVKNQSVIQQLNEIDTIVFDKTGTLTEANHGKVQFRGKKLTDLELASVAYLLSQSTHPLSKQIEQEITKTTNLEKSEISYFFEIEGQGIEGVVNGNFIRIGNETFTSQPEYLKNIVSQSGGSQVHLEINHEYRGSYTIEPIFRENYQEILSNLSSKYNLILLSGDNDSTKNQLKKYFNELYFHQKPQDKLDFIKKLQNSGKKVMMIGDGLNDAGALQEAKVGVAIRQDIQAFTPACDAILDASKFPFLYQFIDFSNTALNIVKISFLLSVVYNFFGIGWAVSGQLSPVLAAIFMPLSSLSVVLFAVGLTYFWAWNKKI